MTKRIIAVLIVLALAIGCVFALAETTTAEPSAEPTAEATAEVNAEVTAEAAAEPTATPIPEGKTRYVSAPSGLYIREAADLKAKIVATPDFNYALKVIGEEGKWSHVIFETNGRVFEGYAWTAYLSDHKTVLKPAAKVEPTAEPTKEPSVEPTPVPGGETGEGEDGGDIRL